MIPPYPPEPRYGDAWKNLKDNAIGYLEDIIFATESEN